MSRTAIITGGSRGIGRGITLALAEHGWHVVINYRTNHTAASDTLRQVVESGGQGGTIQADIGKQAESEKLLQETIDRFGTVNLLVNNAGIAPRMRSDLLDLTPDSYDEVMATNLRGTFFLTQLVAKEMIAAVEAGGTEPPQVININSISAYTSSTTRGEYCLSKAGMAMMTALFADRLAEYGIGVFEIRPGVIATDMTQSVKGRYDRLFKQGLTAINRWGKPADVAKAVIAITEGYFPYSTGEVFNIDGGFHLRRL